MDNLNIYRKLLKLSLFQGLSESELKNIFGSFRFGFHRFHKGAVIVQEGMPCQILMLLTDGEIMTSRWSEKHSYLIEEFFSAPHILQPERLFGISHFFACQVTAVTDVNFITIDKNELQRLIDNHLIVKLNFLNALSLKTQNQEKATWLSAPDNLTERIKRFVKAHTESPTGQKVVHIKMEELGREMNDSRLNVSIALHKLETAGLITLHRSKFVVHQMEHFLTEKTI